LSRLVNEIGEDAVWTLSTAKAGNGVQQLRDNNMQTFWQSDGLQPHLITLEFNKQANVPHAERFLSFHALDSAGVRQLRGHQLQLSSGVWHASNEPSLIRMIVFTP
jgi:hypothetical protein